MLDFKKYRSSLKQYLIAKGFKPDNSPMLCFNPAHSNTHTPACIIKTETFDCKACGIHGDVYDACKILTGIDNTTEQYKEVEQTLGGYTAPPEIKKERFTPDQAAIDKVVLYMRSHAGREKGILAFLKQRGYTDDIAKKMIKCFGYWPGFEIAEKEIGHDTLKKAGIPLINTDKGYSSWDHSGAVEKLGKGLKLNFYIDKKCEKRGSKSCYTFPMFPDLEKIPVIILVEAEITSIAMRAVGFVNTFPTGGTNGLTEKTIKEFLLDKQEIIFAFDGDEAGRKSSGIIPLGENDAKKCYPEIFLKLGYKGSIKLVHLPDGKDPDDLIRENKLEELSKIISGATIYAKIPVDEKPTIDKKEPPFLVLGCDEKAYYAMPTNQNIPIRIGRGDTNIKNWLKEIAPGEWWYNQFQKTDADGNPQFDILFAVSWFREQSQNKGIYDENKIKGLGVHLDGKNIVFNSGSCLYVDSKKLSYNDYKGKNIYCRSKINIEITGEPWKLADGVNLIRQLKTFLFERTVDYMVIAGYMAIAPYASILTWRPHVWLTANKGEGKSTLVRDIIQYAVGKNQALYFEGPTSEAFIRQTCGKDCRVPLLDEFESKTKEESYEKNKIMNFIRSCFGGNTIGKGTPDHKPLTFTTKMMFCLASINVRIDNDGDRTRIVICRMKRKPAADKKHFEPIENFEGLRKRIFLKLKTLNADIKAAKKIIMEYGHNNRTGDTYSPFVVGFWYIISDNAFFQGDEKIQEYIKSAIAVIRESDSKDDDDRILDRIFQERIRIKPDFELSIAEILTLEEGDSIGKFKTLTYDDIIRRHGLRRFVMRGIEVLAVDSDHPAIKAILKDSPFVEYKEILQRHEFVVKKSEPVHMAGKNTRCIIFDWSKIYAKYFEKDKNDDVPF
ncbi:MAG: toprim domain-containing protein [Candidatus Omnitrophica bacterium]|nr:toprim domain-containing protein [Candidatus Omnitrophota bacterium]